MAEAERGCSQAAFRQRVVMARVAANNAAAASFNPVPGEDAPQIQARSVSGGLLTLASQSHRRLALLGSEKAPFCSFFIQYGISLNTPWRRQRFGNVRSPVHVIIPIRAHLISSSIFRNSSKPSSPWIPIWPSRFLM